MDKPAKTNMGQNKRNRIKNTTVGESVK